MATCAPAPPQESFDREYMVRAGYVELYNERVRDLLNPSTKELKIRHDSERGFFVECQEVTVTSPAQVMSLLESGNSVRQVGVTNMNDRSSRSHTIFRIIVESTKKAAEGAGEFRESYLNLVDLAGSERVADTGATGARLKEAININKSLSTLSHIVSLLAERTSSKGIRSHLPYRDSKLTQILQPALGGNNKTAFICNVCLAWRFFEEVRT